MKAIQEIGFKKVIRFIVFTLFMVIFNRALISPLRKFLLNIGGAHIGRNAVILSLKFFNYHYQGVSGLFIGENCFIGEDAQFDLCDKIVLEEHVTISNRVIVLTHTNVGYENHPLQEIIPRHHKPVRCREGSFIGAGAILMPGVTIGKRAVVGAGAVVTKNVAPETVVAGVPAKILRKFSSKKNEKK